MANVDSLINDGVTALKEGRKEDARRLLMQAVDLDEHNEKGWLYLSGCVETLEEQQVCLENVISINPQNQKALKGLETVKAQIANRPGGKPAAPASDPFSKGSSAPTGGGTSPLGPGWGDYAAPSPSGSASSADWGHGSAPAYGSGKDVQLPSPEEYDNWVSGLSLGGNAPADAGSSGFDNSIDTSGFGSFDPSSGPFAAPSSTFDDNPDPFGSGSPVSDPFGKSKPAAKQPASPSPTSDRFGGFDDSSAPSFDSTFGASSSTADSGFGAQPSSAFDAAPPAAASTGGKASDAFSSFDPFESISANDSNDKLKPDAFTPPPVSGGFDDPDLFGDAFSPPTSGKKSDPFKASDPLFKSGLKKDKSAGFTQSSRGEVDLSEVDSILGDSRGGTAFSFGGKSSSSAGASVSRGLYKDIPDDIQIKASRGKGGGKMDMVLVLSVLGLVILNAVSLAALVLTLMKG